MMPIGEPSPSKEDFRNVPIDPIVPHSLRSNRGRFCLVLSPPAAATASLPDYIHNGFKVGPNYCKPPAPVAKHWIDAADMCAFNVPGIQCRWWTVFHDPKLDELIALRLPPRILLCAKPASGFWQPGRR